MNSTKWLAVVVLVVAVLAAAMLWHMQYGGRGKAKRLPVKDVTISVVEKKASAPVSSTSIATQTSLPTTLNVVEQKNEVSPTAAATAGGHEVPLKTDLPKPMLGPTPKPIPPGLRVAPKLQGLRPDFMIPLGCTNLALGKKVTSNDSEPVIGELSLITDGDKEMQEGNYVELAIGKQWVQVDLGFPETLAAILVWRYFSQERVYHSVVVQVSDDPAFQQEVITIFNSDAENVHGFGVGKDLGFIENYQGQLIDAKRVTGRYVRLYSYGNTSDNLNHYLEVEIWGRPAK